MREQKPERTRHRDGQELITAQAAADLAGISASQVRRLAASGRIPGAYLAELEALRGVWYVPMAWAQERGRQPAAVERVRAALDADPDGSLSTIAKRAGCSPAYVSLIRRGLRGAGQRDTGDT
jgi:hypothetical protein